MSKLSIIVPTLTGRCPVLPTGGDIEVVVVRGVRPVSAARFEGLKRSTGDYVWFVDADDEVDCSLRVEDLGLETRPDIVRFKTSCGWMCIGDKIYRKEIVLVAFDEIGVLPLKHCEDGLMYLAALKQAKRVVDVDRVVYKYIQNPDSALHRFNPDVVKERMQFVDLVMRLGVCLDAPGYLLDRAALSGQSIIYIVAQLCRWPATGHQIRQVCRELVASRLYEDARPALETDAYARKMAWVARHPWSIMLQRLVRRVRNGGRY